MPSTMFPLGDNHPDPIFLFDKNSHELTWMNNAAEVWLRKPLSLTKGQAVSELGTGFQDLAKRIKIDPDEAASYRGHDLMVNVRRTDFVCEFNIFAIHNGVALHMSPKELGSGLIQASAAEQSVTMLGKMLAHELKNPLAGIRGAAQLLEADMESADDLELLELIKTEVDRVSRLANRMEKFGQADFENFRHFNVHEVLRKAALLFEHQKIAEVSIVENFDPSLPEVFGDADSVMQVVVNLLANAVDAIGSGKLGDRIEMRTKYRTGIHRRDKSGTKHTLPVELLISDNGPGIPEKIRDRVFQPFVTSKANGQGLGLALISKIVADHGGLIEVSSEPGNTVFSVLLPVDPIQDNETVS